jgi:hypothetical protein
MPHTDHAAITLAQGSHSNTECNGGERCFYEWYNWLTRSKNTDDCPPDVSHVLHYFGMRLNDRLPDGPRQELKRFLPNGTSPLAGTRGDGLDGARLTLMLDWLMHRYAPACLRLAGLDEQAQRMESLPVIRWPATDADAATTAADAAADATTAATTADTATATAAAAAAAAAAADAAADAVDAAADATATTATATADAADATTATTADAAAAATTAAVATTADAATADAATADADAATTAAVATTAAWRFRQLAWDFRDAGWRGLRVVALRAVKGHKSYREAFTVAETALAPFVAEMQGEGLALFERVIRPEL